MLKHVPNKKMNNITNGMLLSFKFYKFNWCYFIALFYQANTVGNIFVSSVRAKLQPFIRSDDTTSLIVS